MPLPVSWSTKAQIGGFIDIMEGRSLCRKQFDCRGWPMTIYMARTSCFGEKALPAGFNGVICRVRFSMCFSTLGKRCRLSDYVYSMAMRINRSFWTNRCLYGTSAVYGDRRACSESLENLQAFYYYFYRWECGHERISNPVSRNQCDIMKAVSRQS